MLEFPIGMDGNCFYRSVSFFLFRDENYFKLIRETLYEFIKKKENILLGEHEYIDYFGKLYPLKDYINLIKNNSFYAGDLEIAQSVYCFKFNIAVYSFDNKDNTYKFQLFYTLNNSEDNINPILILNFNNTINHYQVLNYNYSNTIEPNINNNNINQINNFNTPNKDNIYNSNNMNYNKFSTLSINNINELTKMITNITLKKNKIIKEVSYESMDVEMKIKNGYRYPIYPNVAHGDTMCDIQLLYYKVLFQLDHNLLLDYYLKEFLNPYHNIH